MGLRLIFRGRDALPAREVFAWVDVRKRQSPLGTPLRARWEAVERVLTHLVHRDDLTEIPLSNMERLLSAAQAAHPTPRKTGTPVPGICVKCGSAHPPESFLRRATAREREKYGWRGAGAHRTVKGQVCAKCRYNKARAVNQRRRTKLETPTRHQIQQQIKQTKRNIKSAEGLYLAFFRMRLAMLSLALERADSQVFVEEWTSLLTEQEREELVAAYQVLPRRHGRMPGL